MFSLNPDRQPQRPSVPQLVAELWGEIDNLPAIFLDDEIEILLDDARLLGYMAPEDDEDDPMELAA